MDMISVAARKAAGRDLDARPSDLDKGTLTEISEEIIEDINRRYEEAQRGKSLRVIQDAAQSIDIERATASRGACEKELSSLLGLVRSAQEPSVWQKVTVPKTLEDEINRNEKERVGAGQGTAVAMLLAAISLILAIGSTSFILGGFWWTATVVLALIAGYGPFDMYAKGEPARVLGHARECAQCIGSGVCCTIADLARHLGKSERKTAEILERALDLGLFPQGDFDSERVIFFLNQESRQEYERRLKVHLKRLENLTHTLADGVYTDDLGDVDLEQSPVVDKGRRHARKIGELGRQLSKGEVSLAIERIAAEATCIYAYVEKHPESESKVEQVTEYMLPITLKVISAYAEMEASGVDTPNIVQTRRQIEDALDMLVGTYDKVLDRLYSSIALDISSDIAVLETLAV